MCKMYNHKGHIEKRACMQSIMMCFTVLSIPVCMIILMTGISYRVNGIMRFIGYCMIEK